ncbi:hypothetical protein, partial [Amycolatopsis thermoflava]|uniref:hypothetical protein n=1 Tax=Amycolatopsis thermoflava TaxID=84480 RepID=UPI003666795C
AKMVRTQLLQPLAHQFGMSTELLQIADGKITSYDGVLSTTVAEALDGKELWATAQCRPLHAPDDLVGVEHDGLVVVRVVQGGGALGVRVGVVGEAEAEHAGGAAGQAPGAAAGYVTELPTARRRRTPWGRSLDRPSVRFF